MPFGKNETGECPHCRIVNRFEGVVDSYGSDLSYNRILIGSSTHSLGVSRCTNCGDIVITFGGSMIYPLGSQRNQAPQEVSIEIAEDFNEACLVENLSSKASAALARRCLQNMLHNQGISKSNLSQEIDEARKTLPSHLSEAIDAIRVIGNFSAHPIKSSNSGDIIEVEAGETEWILDTLEQLFDFYYVQPAKTLAKRATLDAKLQAAGKPPIK